MNDLNFVRKISYLLVCPTVARAWPLTGVRARANVSCIQLIFTRAAWSTSHRRYAERKKRYLSNQRYNIFERAHLKF